MGHRRVVHRDAGRAAVAIERLRVQPARIARRVALPQRLWDGGAARRRSRVAVHVPRCPDGLRGRRARAHRARGRRRPTADAVGRDMGHRSARGLSPTGALRRSSRCATVACAGCTRATTCSCTCESPATSGCSSTWRSDHEPTQIDAAALDGVVGECRFGPGDVERRGEAVVLPAAGAGVHIWELGS